MSGSEHEDSDLVTLDLKTAEAVLSSKRELYNMIRYDMRIYLPSFEVTSIDWLKAIMENKRKVRFNPF